jgi:3-oxoadipate enol-lactonase
MAFLAVPEADIYYEVYGQGPPIVFAHGLAGNHMSWWQQIPYFTARYTCVTFAARGFFPSRGKADPGHNADDLRALLERLDFDRVNLVAQSMGGWAAISYMLHHPDKVRALVLASTTGGLRRPVFESAGDERRAGQLRRGVHPAAGERMAREQPNLHHLYRLIDGLSLELDKELLRKRLMAQLDIDPALLAASPVPLLFIVGNEDLSSAEIHWIRKQFQGRRVEVVPETGHSVYFERPQIFNRVVDNFLDSLPA